MHQQSTKTVSYPNVNSAISRLGAAGFCFAYETGVGIRLHRRTVLGLFMV
jgi:hypothetical protein